MTLIAAILIGLSGAALGWALASLRVRSKLVREEDSRAQLARELSQAQARLAAESAASAQLREQLGQSRIEAAADKAQLTATLLARDARSVERAAERDSRDAALADDRATRARELSHSQSEVSRAQSELSAEREQRARLQAELKAEHDSSHEKLQLLEEAQKKLAGVFATISSAALEQNNRQFLDLAQAALEKHQEIARGDLDKRQQSILDLVKPVRESLDKVDGKLGEIEKARVGAYEGLTQQVRSLLDTQGLLRTETQNLAKALRTPHTRGRWAEVQLRRVVELAGMLEHCDFYEQATVTTEEGTLRPDMLVRMPGPSHVVVDAKAPLAAFLDACEAPDEARRKELLRDHARQVRAHMANLGRKAYWDQFESTPDFVVLFLPTDAIFGAALEADPGLMEAGWADGVLLATPMTLMALLRTVAFGWRQDRMAHSAREIAELGRALYDRIATMASHLEKLGKRLSGSVQAYNDAVGSLELRVLPSARKFKELKTGPEQGDIPPLVPLDALPRPLQAPELVLAALPEDAN